MRPAPPPGPAVARRDGLDPASPGQPAANTGLCTVAPALEPAPMPAALHPAVPFPASDTGIVAQSLRAGSPGTAWPGPLRGCGLSRGSTGDALAGSVSCRLSLSAPPVLTTGVSQRGGSSQQGRERPARRSCPSVPWSHSTCCSAPPPVLSVRSRWQVCPRSSGGVAGGCEDLGAQGWRAPSARRPFPHLPGLRHPALRHPALRCPTRRCPAHTTVPAPGAPPALTLLVRDSRHDAHWASGRLGALSAPLLKPRVQL